MSGVGKIGVFDSGFGGLHTLRHIVGALPEYEYIYLGDSARTPYGPRPKAEVLEFSQQAVDFLFVHGCELVIFACNTASSDALRSIQQEYLPVNYPDHRRVLGVSIPLAEAAVRATRGNKIGVLATEGTVHSGVFAREINKLESSIEVTQQSAPRLVPLIEAGEHDSPTLREILTDYLTPIIAVQVDTLILGCTHYGLIADTIREAVGPNMTLISEADAVPVSLANYLARHDDLAAQLSNAGSIEFYTTGETKRFDALGSLFFGDPVRAQHVAL